MKNKVFSLEPNLIWKNFYNLNSIPRASKKEERIIQFMIDFGIKLGLETKKDSIGNVIIVKPATTNMLDKKTVIIQSHLDMVHEKNNDLVFDFDNSGIEMYVDNDWVKAKGTTLGADNGLGVAAIMGLLESDEIEHPKIEALFTIDEETGMTGALMLDNKMLNGDILLNLDTEEDDEIGIGCAGGVDITIKNSYKLVNIADLIFLDINISGMSGGHSGMEIHKNLANSNKILNSILIELNNLFPMHLAEISGGGLRNAIPRESSIIVGISKDIIKDFENNFVSIFLNYKNIFKSTDPNMNYSFKKNSNYFKVLDSKSQTSLLQLIDKCPNGVYKMSKDIEGLVETSNNLANIKLIDGRLIIKCLTRSSVESSKLELKNIIASIFKEYSINFSGDYPGWQPNPNSQILKVLVDVYEKLNNSKPNVAACHAGLECGIIGSHYPGLDMISFGPTIRGAHSPDERASISSTKKFWDFLIEILKNIPNK